MSYVLNDFLFVGTATKTVANTSSETTIFPSSFVGGLTVPANFWSVGSSIKIRCGGVFSTFVTPGNLTVNVKLGGVTIATVVIAALLASANNNGWTGEMIVTCRSAGASGTVVCDGLISYAATSITRNFADLDNNGATSTVDTTAATALDITVTWATASTSNTISCVTSSVEVINLAPQ